MHALLPRPAHKPSASTRRTRATRCDAAEGPWAYRPLAAYLVQPEALANDRLCRDAARECGFGSGAQLTLTHAAPNLRRETARPHDSNSERLGAALWPAGAPPLGSNQRLDAVRHRIVRVENVVPAILYAALAPRRGLSLARACRRLPACGRAHRSQRIARGCARAASMWPGADGRTIERSSAARSLRRARAAGSTGTCRAASRPRKAPTVQSREARAGRGASTLGCIHGRSVYIYLCIYIYESMYPSMYL